VVSEERKRRRERGRGRQQSCLVETKPYYPPLDVSRSQDHRDDQAARVRIMSPSAVNGIVVKDESYDDTRRVNEMDESAFQSDTMHIRWFLCFEFFRRMQM
jgi:hypothetical protein